MTSNVRVQFILTALWPNLKAAQLLKSDKKKICLCQYYSNSYLKEIEKVKPCNHNGFVGKRHFLIMTDRVSSGSPQFPVNRSSKYSNG